MTQNSMNAKELREALPPMVIWMADATIREARRSITGNTGWPKPNRNGFFNQRLLFRVRTVDNEEHLPTKLGTHFVDLLSQLQ